ncbi:MAG: MaoC family dehydratase N-terminal domain-containing protein [Candidatus Dormibacteraeota bacterium]|nr:MaoC family dehydratase N-terminal domain-containing protein [Candidatus Dormibacteraeota bacterium]
MSGREYPPVDLTIDREHTAAFARALGSDPGQGVPPTYAAVYALGATARQLFADAEAAIDFANLLHAEQEFEWDRQAVEGEVVTARGRVSSDSERRGTRFIRFETEVTGAGGAPLCRSRALFVVRGSGG